MGSGLWPEQTSAQANGRPFSAEADVHTNDNIRQHTRQYHPVSRGSQDGFAVGKARPTVLDHPAEEEDVVVEAQTHEEGEGNDGRDPAETVVVLEAVEGRPVQDAILPSARWGR